MNTSNEKKRNIWVYLILGLMLLTLLSFSLLPIITSFSQINKSADNSDPYALSVENQAQLEDQAQGYEIVLQREPDNPTALRGLLDTRLQLGDLPGAIIALERLAQITPDRPDYTLLLAQAKEQIQDFSGAENAYLSLVDAHPEDMNAWQGLVNLLIGQNRSAEAIAKIQDTIKKNANSDASEDANPRAMQLLLAQVFALEKQDQEAIAVYDQLIDADKEDFRPLLAKGLVLRDQGKKAEAITLFDAAFTLAPEPYKLAIQKLALETSEPTDTEEKKS